MSELSDREKELIGIALRTMKHNLEDSEVVDINEDVEVYVHGLIEINDLLVKLGEFEEPLFGPKE